MGTGGYAVRWVEANAARPEHLEIWNRNLAMKVTPARRFEWLYRDNPIGPGRLAVLEALDEKGASQGFVGTAGHGMRAFQDGARRLRAALLCDVAVDLGHRTAMPAFMVTTQLRKHVLATYDIAYGFPNHLSEPLVARGYKKLGATKRYALALRHERYLKAKIPQPLVARGAALALDAARAALVSARAAPAATRYRLEWVTEEAVDDRFDRLWREAAPDYAIVGVRDASFVRWRFFARAEGRLAVVALVSRLTNEIAAYAAIQQEGEVAHVRDLFGHVGELSPLLRLLSFMLMKQGASSISLRLQAPPAVLSVLDELGFRERADLRSVVVGVGKPAESLAASIYDLNRWYITEADEDV
jgi:hypothetical protein